MEDLSSEGIRMKYIKIQNNGKPKYLDKKEPSLRKGWAKIKVASCGLCGSDITKIISDKEARLFINKNIWGHEFSGVIDGIETNRNFKKGERVVIQPLIFEKSKEITKAKSLGKEYGGGFSEYVLVPINNLVKIPSNVSFELSCLTEPIAVCIHAKNLVKVKKDSKILVIGDGAIGILLALVLKVICEESYIKGKNKKNLEIANQLGIKIFNNQDTNYEFVFETVGRKQDSTLSEAIKFIAPKGKIIVLGVFNKNYINKLNLRNLFFKEASITGSNCYNGMDDFKEALKFVKKNKNKLSKIITHKFELRDFNKALTIIKNKKNEAVIKMLFVNESK